MNKDSYTLAAHLRAVEMGLSVLRVDDDPGQEIPGAQYDPIIAAFACAEKACRPFEQVALWADMLDMNKAEAAWAGILESLAEQWTEPVPPAGYVAGDAPTDLRLPFQCRYVELVRISAGGDHFSIINDLPLYLGLCYRNLTLIRRGYTPQL